ncbi:MAG TPA: hypothetical protein VHU17_04970 [Acidimicrobiales bacterium]|nr:hypothetical protein [Acidimicrobiales bacterium]
MAAALVVVAMLATACGSSKKTGSNNTGNNNNSSSSSHIGGGFTLATQGGAGEGPYPWKYPASGTVSVGSGTTISGASCSQNGTQVPNATYSVPCIAKFTGNNGGATYNGVTANQITIANRVFPGSANTAEAAAVAKQEGIALAPITDQVQAVFLDYFNKTFDLYGRKVVIQPEASDSNSTLEALNENQAQACADADKIANNMHAFGEWGVGDNNTGGGGSGPFSICAAQQKMVEFSGGAYFNEAFYQQNNPYVWDLPMDCERVADSGAQAVAQLVLGKKAAYAGDANLRTATRKLGIYVPNLPAYTDCTNQFISKMESQFHQPAASVNHVFTYGLDISTFQQSAQQAIVQFKAGGVTTIITACDSFSLSLLTKAAAAQNYHPEWLLNGVAGDDTDSVAQTYDQSEVTGHLFGLSEASPQTQIFGPSSLAGKLYQKLTGHAIPAGTDGNYADLVWMFNALQAAGPDLTPNNMARGVHALPSLGAPDYSFGKWDLSTNPEGKGGYGDHTLVSDARFIFWNATGTSGDNGKQGTYVPVFSGQRYGIGQWPTTLPTLFGS